MAATFYFMGDGAGDEQPPQSPHDQVQQIINIRPLLEEADKDQAETNLGQFHEQRREQGSLNIDENQVEPCNFINGIANETRTRASINQANKFASNVLGDTVVEEMTKSEPPELAPGSTSSVRGNEKKPPHGRGCVTIQEPSAKHKLRRTLALHAGLRKCAAATI